MGWRFRKIFKILPGVRLNIGKTGITGVNVGKRGLSATIGKLGIFRNIGIPGTGLSHRSRVGDSPSATDALVVLAALVGAAVLGVILVCVIFVVIGWNIGKQEQPKPVRLVSNPSMTPMPTLTPTPIPKPVKSMSTKKSKGRRWIALSKPLYVKLT